MYLKKKALILFYILLYQSILSCSLLERINIGQRDNTFETEKYKAYEKEDFLNHLNYLGESFLKNNKDLIIELRDSDENYLVHLAERIVLNNELLIKNSEQVKFYIIRDQTPYHFSLPNCSIFISLGLIKKYIRNEGDLVSIISFELVRSSRSLFYYNVIVPTGSISAEKILKLIKLNLDDKKIVNKWMYYILKRSGYDPYFYLSWIQQINKNSSDFILMLGDTQQISWEEFELKSFFIKKKNMNTISKIKNNSSKEFYSFKNNLREKKI